MVPAYRFAELEHSTTTAATAIDFGEKSSEIMTTDGSEETLFDMYEDLRDYDLGEGD